MIATPTIREVIAQLRAARLASNPSLSDETQLAADLFARAHRGDTTPWFVRALVGWGAWIAALMFLGFLALVGILRTEQAAIGLGVILHGFALATRRSDGGRGDFIGQLALSTNLLAQLLVIGGVSMLWKESPHADALLTLLVCAYMVVVFPDRTQRFLSGAAFALALCFLFLPDRIFRYDFDPPSLGPGLRVCRELSLVAVAWLAGAALLVRHRSRRVLEIAIPAGFGLLVALFHLLAFAAVPGGWHELSALLAGSITTAGIGGGVIVLEIHFLREKSIPLTARPALVAIGGTILMMIIARDAPGILAAAGALLIGFRRGSALLMGLAAAFLCGFLGGFYYNLGATLLQKSIALSGGGALLLGLRAYVVRTAPVRREEVA